MKILEDCISYVIRLKSSDLDQNDSEILTDIYRLYAE
jgi:hypothetical protein